MDQAVARKMVIEDHLCPDIPILERKWYYSIEISPGVWTDGRHFENLHLTREALKRMDLSGASCLDIGTMEAAVPVLLSRRGVTDIVAYDRMNFSDRIDFLKQRLNVKFDLVHGMPLSGLEAELQARRGSDRALFDVVVFSGVLYHMFDILGGLLHARRQVKNGGILLVETAAMLSDEQVALLNAGGRFMPGDNYWLPTLGCLDTLLRLCRLAPLDATYLRLKAATRTNGKVVRVCVPCLATSHTPSAEGDNWIRASQKKDFSEYLDWSVLEAAARKPMTYDLAGRAPRMTSFETADVFQTVRRTCETRPASKTMVGVSLEDRY